MRQIVQKKRAKSKNNKQPRSIIALQIFTILTYTIERESCLKSDKKCAKTCKKRAKSEIFGICGLSDVHDR